MNNHQLNYSIGSKDTDVLPTNKNLEIKLQLKKENVKT